MIKIPSIFQARSILVLTILVMLSCCDLIKYHPFDANVSGERSHNENAIEEIQLNLIDKSEFKFALIGDSHRWYDELAEVVDALNKIEGLDFVIHSGDVTDMGITQQFDWSRRILKKLKVPYIVILGNHDMLGSGLEVYKAMYGAENFVFTLKDVRFVCVNTNGLEYNDHKPVPDYGFLNDEIKNYPEACKRTIFVIHAPPLSEQFVDDNSTLFQETIRRYPNLMFCLNGHVHELYSKTLFKDSVMYYSNDKVKHKVYQVFTVKQDGYDYQKISL